MVKFLGRVEKEFRGIRLHNPTNFTFDTIEGDLLKCYGILCGPDDSPYRGGIFYVSITIPNNYPLQYPVIIFMTKVFHPSVRPDGSMCYPCYAEEGSPILTIETLLEKIRNSFLEPHICCGTGRDAYVNNREEFNRIAQEGTKEYAM